MGNTETEAWQKHEGEVQIVGKVGAGDCLTQLKDTQQSWGSGWSVPQLEEVLDSRTCLRVFPKSIPERA